MDLVLGTHCELLLSCPPIGPCVLTIHFTIGTYQMTVKYRPGMRGIWCYDGDNRTELEPSEANQNETLTCLTPF